MAFAANLDEGGQRCRSWPKNLVGRLGAGTATKIHLSRAALVVGVSDTDEASLERRQVLLLLRGHSLHLPELVFAEAAIDAHTQITTGALFVILNTTAGINHALWLSKSKQCGGCNASG